MGKVVNIMKKTQDNQKIIKIKDVGALLAQIKLPLHHLNQEVHYYFN